MPGRTTIFFITDIVPAVLVIAPAGSSLQPSGSRYCVNKAIQSIFTRHLNYFLCNARVIQLANGILELSKGVEQSSESTSVPKSVECNAVLIKGLKVYLHIIRNIVCAVHTYRYMYLDSVGAWSSPVNLDMFQWK